MTKEQTLITLVITTIINAFLTMYLSKKKSKNQLNKVFVWALSLLILWSVGLIAQITLAEPLNIEPIYFDYFVYIGACFVPVAVFFMGLIYANTKIELKKRYLLLFIIIAYNSFKFREEVYYEGASLVAKFIGIIGTLTITLIYSVFISYISDILVKFSNMVINIAVVYAISLAIILIMLLQISRIPKNVE